MSLVCKKWGYKQHDDATIAVMKSRFSELEEHDIPYFCGACMDKATDEEYEEYLAEMLNGSKPQCPLGGDETNDCQGCAYSKDYHFVDGECVIRDG